MSSAADVPSTGAAVAVPIPAEHLAIFQTCRKFVDDEKDNSSGHWELMHRSAAFEEDPLSLESCKYKPYMEANPDIICVRGRLRFPGVMPRQVIDLIVNLDTRREWDSQMESGDRRVSYDVGSENREGILTADIASLRYKGQQPFVAPRDLCLARFTEDLSPERDETHLALYAKSVVHDAVPEDASGTHVRAELHECGYIMQLREDTSGTFFPSYFTDVTYISSLDFKGNIPSTFTNIILRQQPATLLEMLKLLDRSAIANGKEKQCTVM